MSEPTPEDPSRRGVETMYQRARGAVINGVLRPGQVISLADLAVIVDGSRTPLREAVRMLGQDGFLVAEANRRVTIAPLNADHLEDIQMARIALESMAVRVTVPMLRTEDIAELEGLLAQMSHFADDGDFPRMDLPHHAFHSLITSAVGESTQRYLDLLSDHIVRYRREFAPTDLPSGRDRLVEHRRILDAIKAADADTAADELVDHYLRVTEWLWARMGIQRPPERLWRAARAARIGASS